jgi:hypothetical protein
MLHRTAPPPRRTPVGVRRHHCTLFDQHVDNAHRWHKVSRAPLIDFEPLDRYSESQRRRANTARVVKPRGPTSTIAPSGESTGT